MNKINDAREKVERAKALLAEAEAELREAEQPAEVCAYIGTKVEAPSGYAIVCGAVVEPNGKFVRLQYRYNNSLRPDHGQAAINGQAVTHFQPIKAEIVQGWMSKAWYVRVNGVELGRYNDLSTARARLRNLARAIAPWWDGELVITERGA